MIFSNNLIIRLSIISFVWLIVLSGLLFSAIPFKNFFILALCGVGISLLLAQVWRVQQRQQQMREVLHQLATDQLLAPLVDSPESSWKTSVNTLYYKLNEAAEFIKTLGHEDTTSKIYHIKPTETLGKALLDVEETLRSFREQEAKRRWRAEGLARLADILRTNTDDIQEFGHQVIQELVKYLGANQASFFLENKNTDGRYLELIASYAYDKKKYQQKEVKLGQGLVGQCALERKPILLSDVPQDYINITSGLGESAPNQVIIVPLLFQERTLGVIEIAAFQKIDNYKRLFLEKAAKNIASTIGTIQGNSHTRQLLEDSQRLTIKLQERENKMQQHLEELALMQQEMEKNQAELEGVFTAMDTALCVAFFDLEGNIAAANQNFASLTGYSKEALLNQDSVILNANQITSDFWENLGQGNEILDDFRLISSTDQEVWVHASLSPIKATDGQIEKFLMLGTDITKKKLVLEKLSLVANKTDNSVIITDKGGRIEYVNDGFVKLTGYAIDEVIGKKPGTLLQGAKTDPQTIDRIRQKLQHGVPFYEEILNYTKTGESYWISLMINPVRDEEGKIERFVSIQANITKIKEAALDYTYKLEAISKSNAIVEFNPQGQVVDMNSMFLEITGYKKEDLAGQSYTYLIPEGELEKPQTHMMWDNVKTGTFFSGEFKQKSKEGAELWLNGTFNPIFDLDHKLIKIMMFAQFTTREKEKQQELMRTVQILNDVVLTFELNTSGYIRKPNQRLLSTFGYKRVEIARKKIQDLLPEGTELPKMTKLIRSDEPQEYSLPLITKAGVCHHYQGTFIRLKDLRKNQSKVMVILLESNN